MDVRTMLTELSRVTERKVEYQNEAEATTVRLL